MADLKTTMDIVFGTDKAQSDALNEAGNVLQQAAANRLLRSTQAGADQAIKAHSNKRFQELDIQARYGQLPESLTLDEIAYLMGEPVEPFVQFMKKTSLKYEIKKATKAYGAFETGLMLTGSLGDFFCNKADVKNWLQSIGKWPIDGPLANWWKKDKPEPHANKPQKPDDVITRRTNDFQAWIDEAKPDLNAMTWPQIYEALKSRNSTLWFSNSSFETWKKKQQIHKKGQNGRPLKPR